MVRNNYPNTSIRQQQKSKNGRGSVFGVFRPVSMDSAEELYEMMKNLKMDGILPETSHLRDPSNMHVTYLERRKFTKQLQGFSQGFNTHEAIGRINNRCEGSRQQTITVSLGRVSLMDRRDETLVARLDHNQIVADEYSYTTSALRALHVHIKDQFKPHIGLARVPGLPITEKKVITHQVQDVIPEEVNLDPLVVEPPLRRHRD